MGKRRRLTHKLNIKPFTQFVRNLPVFTHRLNIQIYISTCIINEATKESQQYQAHTEDLTRVVISYKMTTSVRSSI